MSGPTSPEAIALVNAIADRHGGVVLPEHVVEAARPAASPLHDSFNWDDTEAAEKWRLHQARNLLRIMVEYLPADKSQSEPTRVFVALRTEATEGGGYRRMADVLSDEEMREALLSQAHDDMRTFTQRYTKLQELAEVFAAFKKVRRPSKQPLARLG